MNRDAFGTYQPTLDLDQRIDSEITHNKPISAVLCAKSSRKMIIVFI